MPARSSTTLKAFLSGLAQRNPGQPDFHQAVEDVLTDIWPMVEDTPAYREAEILRRIVEPDRVVSFRVVWADDQGRPRVERGWRVQHSNAIGPYKGGLRFAADLDEGVLKFLAFEQTFKNSLTGLPLGSGKGGATFNPRGKSDAEVMRFCQSFMTELHRHIGPDRDVPAGDMGVGAREIGYLFGQYKRLVDRFEGVLTGKGLSYGGSPVRSEATGYGVVLFLATMMDRADDELKGRRVAISGSGNVALYAAKKAVSLGGCVISLSDSDGLLHAPDGLTDEQADAIMTLKLEDHGRLSDLPRTQGLSYHKGRTPWSLECDVALPCATQNELDEDDAERLLGGGTRWVVEGANMPCTPKAVAAFRKARIGFGPAKAANAGGVAVSGLEMAQNAARMSWTEDRLHTALEDIMTSVHDRCVADGQGPGGYIDYARGANIAGFRKVADAMVAQGWT